GAGRRGGRGLFRPLPAAPGGGAGERGRVSCAARVRWAVRIGGRGGLRTLGATERAASRSRQRCTTVAACRWPAARRRRTCRADGCGAASDAAGRGARAAL